MHVSVNVLGYRFEQCSVTSHYPKQCWLIANSILRRKHKWYSNWNVLAISQVCEPIVLCIKQIHIFTQTIVKIAVSFIFTQSYSSSTQLWLKSMGTNDFPANRGAIYFMLYSIIFANNNNFETLLTKTSCEKVRFRKCAKQIFLELINSIMIY